MNRFTRVVPRLPTADLARTIDFYERTLGFSLGSLWPDDAPTFAILNRDGISVQFSYSRSAGSTETTLCIDVDDVQTLHNALAPQVNIEWGPEIYWYGRREFAIRDPNGYLVIFSEETADPPTCHENATD